MEQFYEDVRIENAVAKAHALALWCKTRATTSLEPQVRGLSNTMGPAQKQTHQMLYYGLSNNGESTGFLPIPALGPGPIEKQEAVCTAACVQLRGLWQKTVYRAKAMCGFLAISASLLAFLKRGCTIWGAYLWGRWCSAKSRETNTK